MLTKSLICVAGLPHAGSTVLCQLLGQHPQFYSPGYPSPLCPALIELRQSLSDRPVLLSQMGLDSATVHRRLLAAFQGLINGWFEEVQQNWVVDKQGEWLKHLELLQLLDPHCRILVCVRELGQIWGSIETQHQKTLLFDFPDHLAQLTPIERADRLFAADGQIGQPIRSLEAVQDRAAELQSRLYYVVYEHLVSDPKDAMRGIFEWLGLPPVEIDPQHLNSQELNPPHFSLPSGESERQFRYKSSELLRSKIELRPPHPVPPRIAVSLHQNFRWFYEMFYPGLLEA